MSPEMPLRQSKYAIRIDLGSLDISNATIKCVVVLRPSFVERCPSNIQLLSAVEYDL